MKVLNPPKRLWLVYGDIERDAEHHECGEVTWCTEQQYPSDVEYVLATNLKQLRAERDALRDWQHCAIGLLQAAYGEACVDHNPECPYCLAYDLYECPCCHAHALIGGARS